MIAGLILATIAFAVVFAFLKSRNPGDPDIVERESDNGSGNIIAVGKDEAGKLSQLMVIVPEGQAGYSVYIIPALTLANTPGHGFQKMEKAYELGGQELLDQTVADLLQIPVQYHISFSSAAVEITAEQAGSINIKTDRPLVVNTENGPVNLAAGDNIAGARLALTYLKGALTDKQSGPQVQALFYRGLREALLSRSEVDRRSFAAQLARRLEMDLSDDDFSDLLVAMTTPGGDFGVWPLPVKAVVNGANWYFEPVPDQIDTLMTGLPTDAGFNLEIQNGTGAVGVVEAAGTRLTPLRYNMTLMTDPSGVNYDFTQIRTGTEAVNEGNRVRDVLGKGTLIKDEYLEKRQIIVIIGKDLSLAELEKR
ncbi:MAG: LCP family protein [Thermoleophilia bacterium]